MLKNEEAMALAKFLGVDVEDIEDNGAHYYTVRGSDKEYFVADYDDSYEAAKEYIKDLIDYEGIGIFSKNFQEYILEEFCDYPWEEEVEESNRIFCENISSEKAFTSGYANRLVEECIDKGIISPEDCQKNKEGLLDYEDEDELIDKYVEELNDNYSSIKEWFEDFYGYNWAEEPGLRERLNSYIDIDKIAEEVVDEDGIAHILNHYDGSEEVEEINGTNYYIYRQN